MPGYARAPAERRALRARGLAVSCAAFRQAIADLDRKIACRPHGYWAARVRAELRAERDLAARSLAVAERRLAEMGGAGDG